MGSQYQNTHEPERGAKFVKNIIYKKTQKKPQKNIYSNI